MPEQLCCVIANIYSAPLQSVRSTGCILCVDLGNTKSFGSLIDISH